MILQSLVDYYEILAAAGKISKPGYSMANVSYALNLSKDGELINIIPLKISVQSGKKMVDVPQALEVPEQQKKTVGIAANFLCENSGYVLGIDNKGKPERALMCFDTFKALHHEILDDVDCIEAKAVLNFLDYWQPDDIEIPDAIKASMEFCGEEGFGSISLTVPALMCMELASNILGMEPDDPNSQNKAEDALKELLNVITGRLATGIFGSKPVFTLSVPEVVIMDRDSWINGFNDPNTLKFSADSRLVLLNAEFRR